MNPERENVWEQSQLIRIMEDLYKVKFKEAGIPTESYEDMEGEHFDCEHFSLKEIVQLSINQLLDLYNDYTAMYNITKETKFKARATLFKTQCKRKMERQVN